MRFRKPFSFLFVKNNQECKGILGNDMQQKKPLLQI